MLSRRKIVQGAGLALATGALGNFGIAQAKEAGVNEDGLHVQDWFLESFMEVNDDQQDAASAGKHLAVLFEQRGCPYCAEMHKVNLAKPAITDFIKANFDVLQINIWGSKNVTALDGEELEERDFARKWGVNFTPTIVFLRDGDLKNIPIKMAEAARMPGYLKPFHFLSMFEFVAGKHYEDQIFQRFLQEKFERYKAEGKEIDLW